MADLKEFVEEIMKNQNIREPNVYPKGEWITLPGTNNSTASWDYK